jgi:hypothetical protein
VATLTATNIGHAGTDIPLTAAAGGGDLVPIGNGIVFLVRNGGGSDCTVTLAVVATVDGLVVPSRTFAVNAGDMAAFPMLDIYRNVADGMCHVTYSQVTSVTVGCVASLDVR